ncbi:MULTISPECIES: hypothetical protein [unclassified Rhizobium]|nr:MULTISPECIES: hypothetical protein [unclassified Rhizobium]
MSWIERKLAKQNDEFGSGAETQRVTRDITEHLVAHDLRGFR